VEHTFQVEIFFTTLTATAEGLSKSKICTDIQGTQLTDSIFSALEVRNKNDYQYSSSDKSACRGEWNHKHVIMVCYEVPVIVQKMSHTGSQWQNLLHFQMILCRHTLKKV
jgi:hypothetical protein